MNDFEIFDLIQCKVMSMDLNSQISLLNDCLDTLNNLQNNTPELRNIIKSSLTNVCYFDEETYNLFQYVINNCDIRTNDILTAIQKGGMIPGDENNQMVLATSPTSGVQTTTLNQTTSRQITTQFIAQQPINPLDNISLILQSGNLSSDAQMELIKIFGSVAEGTVAVQKAQAEAIKSRTRIEEANATWDRTFEKGSIAFSFTAPGAAIYFLRSTMDKIAISTLNAAGKVVGSVAETAELGVRNIVPLVVNTGLNLGKQVKGYLPTFIVETGKTLSKSSAAQYATDSTANKIIESTTTASTDISSSTILFGCIVFYISLVLLCVIITTIVNKLRKINKIGFYVGIPGVWSVNVASADKGGKRKTKRRKTVLKKTRRRYY